MNIQPLSVHNQDQRIRDQTIEKAKELVTAFRESNNAIKNTASHNNRTQQNVPSAELTHEKSSDLRAWLSTLGSPSQRFSLQNADDQQDYWILGTEDFVDVILNTDAPKAPFHFVIERQGDHWFLKCMDNRLELRVNGEPVKIALLEDGDKIDTAGTLFKFHINHSR